MAREIDRKLRLTAALLGAVTRKDLAAAFRRANPASPFDVERASKWLQGRARPREQQVYEDWAKVVDIGRSGEWIAECDSESFLKAICERHQCDRDALRRRVDGERLAAAQHQDRAETLVGTYVCYTHAWSPYLRGRLIRGGLSITAAPPRLSASYAEVVPTGRLQLDGSVMISNRAMLMDVREIGGSAHFLFCLFPPTPPMSVLAGYMCGATLIGPAQPTVTRIVMVRLPAASPRLNNVDAYLGAQASVAEDLVSLGVPVADSAEVDRRMGELLTGGQAGGLDQIATGAYAALVELFDRVWLAPVASIA